MSLKNYENTLKSYIHDDDKFVTYKWLSKELNIHINSAKDVLKQYWGKFKNKENIIATFLLIGQLKDESIHVEVVRESDLDFAKQKFSNIYSEHLYSLQKFIEELSLLAYAGDGDIQYSAITCNEKYISNSDKGEKSQSTAKTCESQKKVESKNFPEKVCHPDHTCNQTKQNNKDSNDMAFDLMEETKLENKTNTFQKKSTLPSQISTTTKNIGKNGKAPLQSKKSGFNNLFGKVNETNSKKSKANLVDEDINQSKEEEKEDNVCIINEKENGNGVKVVQSEDQMLKENAKKHDCKKRSRSDDKNRCTKRKRIVDIESSDDESDKNSKEHEEEEEEVIEENKQLTKSNRSKSPLPPAEKHQNGKRMIRKSVDKTYKDEEGYLVTKRVYVYEVAPEETRSSEKLKDPLPQSKTTNGKTKKQTMLTNFFKKS